MSLEHIHIQTDPRLGAATPEDCVGFLYGSSEWCRQRELIKIGGLVDRIVAKGNLVAFDEVQPDVCLLFDGVECRDGRKTRVVIIGRVAGGGSSSEEQDRYFDLDPRQSCQVRFETGGLDNEGGGGRPALITPGHFLHLRVLEDGQLVNGILYGVEKVEVGEITQLNALSGRGVASRVK